MDLSGKIAEIVTPAKDPQSNRSKFSEITKFSENQNPNITSPGLKFSNSAATKSATKSQKLIKNPNLIASPSLRNKIRERKFVVARKNSKRKKPNSSKLSCKCKVNMGVNPQKCLCVAYQSLRASQEEFFNNRSDKDDQFDSENFNGANNGVEEEEDEEKNANPICQNPEFASEYEEKPEKFDCFTSNGLEICDPDEIKPSCEMGSSSIKRRREKLLEEARQSVPETGCGRVLHLVNAFERLLSIPKSKNSDQLDEKELEDNNKVMKWALPGLQHPKAPETQFSSSSSFGPSDFFVTSESLGLSSSLDSRQGSFSLSRTSGGGWRSRRNSTESCGTSSGSHWKKRQLKVTSQKPFKLRTEQRGRHKEEELVKKIQQMMIEEEKQRIPIAQGLPWTTDEPECLVKPPVKEITLPMDLVLHSDVRAVDRAEFDHQVAEKMSLIEQFRIEQERQQKLEEEEEIRRLRRELVPRAQPMPYFDRPFIPKRSLKHPTIPREPKFHIPQHKKIKCYTSWNDMYAHHQC